MSAGRKRPRRPEPSVRDFEASRAAGARTGGAQRESQRSRRPALLADDVAEIVGMNAQLEGGLVAGDAEHDHLDLLRMIDESLGHERDEVAELQVFGFGLATATAAGIGDGRDTGTDDSFSPATSKRVVHRADNRSAGIA